jgi:hypothetical protein
MYLMDSITHTAAMLARQKMVPRELEIYGDLAERLKGVPRYLLDAKATRTAVELNLGRPKVLLEAMCNLHIPYPKLWVEWDDADRQALRAKFDEPMSYPELRPMPSRVGFLVETAPDGRTGTATWAWTPTVETAARDQRLQLDDGRDARMQFAIANIGAVQPYFDLDRRFEMAPEGVEGLLKGNLARQWLDNPVQLAALFDIWRTCDHRPSEWGERYLAALGNDQLATALSYADVVGEYIMIWAVLLLLTASRPIVDLVPIDLGRLNRRRTKRGETALLDYTQVTLRLSAPDPQYNPVIRGALGYARKSPRIHLVSSYLARRGDKHWIVQPYMRGKGEVIHRRIYVKG